MPIFYTLEIIFNTNIYITYMLITTDDGNTSKDNSLYFGRKSVDYNGTNYAVLNKDDMDKYGPETVTVKYFSSGSGRYWEVLHIDNGVVNIVNQLQDNVPTLP